MTRVTLAFDNLQQLAECVVMLSIRRPQINYDERTIMAALSEKQMEQLGECRCTIISLQKVRPTDEPGSPSE
ncbi:MAG: hypothetical protein EOO06_15945 [Chitinophagaceae bacterium]|nr:MAG: hypothetical protein EOO06_15945 [Chitinophagaceae bacterium]